MLEDKAYAELQARLEKAYKEIAYYKRLSQEAGDLRLRETEELSRLIAKLKETEKALEKAKDELEHRVEVRTAELSKANDTLKQEILERKQAEEALRESEEKYRQLAEDMPMFISTFLPDGTLTYINNALAAWVNMTPAEIVGKNISTFIFADEYENIKIQLASLTPEHPLETHEQRYLRPGGSEIFHQWTNRAFFDAQGQVTHFQAIGLDITDRKRMEEEFIRAHKLESLGVLAGGIAHDFNNLMAIVQGYIDMALMDIPHDHVSRQRLLTAMGSVEQTKDLTNRLITFSRGGGPHRKKFDVAEILRDAVHRTIKGTDVRVKFDFTENLWPVEADEHQMKQCFYNLTANAMEAMPLGGNLAIRTENTLIPAGEFPDVKGGSCLKITFSDDGIGIPDEHLSKIFDPYFTTKEMASQKGMGLGLSVCYSVLKKHNGHITVKSQPGKGTSFVLYLPARGDLAKGKEIKKVASTGPVRVLVMDDEPHIRLIMRVYLERLGYEVTDVMDGQKAIDVYAKAFTSTMPFDLVILDLTIPQGLGGRLTIERLLKIDPSIKAIIASGFVDDPVIENFADYGFLGALKKPFKREEMKYLVKKILHGN